VNLNNQKNLIIAKVRREIHWLIDNDDESNISKHDKKQLIFCKWASDRSIMRNADNYLTLLD
jgi:hypothetical protein